MSEQITRTYTYQKNSYDAELIASMDGLEFMQALVEGRIAPAAIAETLGFKAHQVERGRFQFRGVPGEHLMNPIGMVHGGYAATMLDSCMGCAVHSTVPKGMSYTTAELSLNCVRAIQADTGPLIAEGKTIHTGRTISTAEGRLFGEADGKLYAHGTTTCLIIKVAT